jgi:hypothetical protein
MIEDILGAIFVIISFVVYVWIYDAGCKKIDIKIQKNRERMNSDTSDVFYNKYAVGIWFIFVTYLWLYVIYKVTGVSNF